MKISNKYDILQSVIQVLKGGGSVPTKVLNCESVILSKVRGSEQHFHSWLEIYYLERGECNCLINDTVYKLTDGDIMLIPPNVIHRSTYNSKNHTRLLINCSDAFYSDKVYKIIENGYIYRNPIITKDILSILKKVEEEINNKDCFCEEMVANHLNALFVLLIRNKNYYKNSLSENVHVKHTLEYVNQHYAENISLEKAAQQAFISSAHLSRIFKKETGLTFGEYLTDIRINAAENLLKNSNLTICEISDSCGFNDSNYFSFKFKSLYNISPLKFRKKFRSKI